jgi:hypothetical protein
MIRRFIKILIDRKKEMKSLKKTLRIKQELILTTFIFTEMDLYNNF